MLVRIRPIEPDDAARWVRFIEGLSAATRYKRGAVHPDQLTAQLVNQRVAPDPAREIALVADAWRAGDTPIAGVARLCRRSAACWEFMLVVGDAWQRRGIGRGLMGALLEAAPAAGCCEVEGTVLASNRGMIEFAERLSFAVEPSDRGPLFRRLWKRLAA